MAVASLVLTLKPYPKGVDNTQRRQILYGTAVITAGDGTAASTGIPVSWNKIKNPSGVGFVQPLAGPKQTKPEVAQFQGQGTEATAQQQYTYDFTNGSVLVWVAGVQVTTGIVADTLTFRAEFIRGGY